MQFGEYREKGNNSGVLDALAARKANAYFTGHELNHEIDRSPEAFTI